MDLKERGFPSEALVFCLNNSNLIVLKKNYDNFMFYSSLEIKYKMLHVY